MRSLTQGDGGWKWRGGQDRAGAEVGDPPLPPPLPSPHPPPTPSPLPPPPPPQVPVSGLRVHLRAGGHQGGGGAHRGHHARGDRDRARLPRPEHGGPPGAPLV